jgi:hypothetical protein
LARTPTQDIELYKNMKDIKDYTYLLGAGASAQKIPVVLGFDKKIRLIQNLVSRRQLFHNSKTQDRLIELLNWYYNEVKSHATIDTLAKKFFLTGDEDNYNKLKHLIEFSFVVWHQSNHHYLRKNNQSQDEFEFSYDVDPRYDAFFAQILKKEVGGLQLPDNIKMLSWNYDVQAEYSISKFFKKETLNDLIETNMVFPQNNYKEIQDDKFMLIKLNGTFCGEVAEANESYLYEEFNFNDIKSHVLKNSLFDEPVSTEKSKIEILSDKLIDKIDSKSKSGILYSWENNPAANRIREISLNAVKNTDALIVIGYSFPNFNREIDKSLLSKMGGLREVYIQVENREKFEIIKSKIVSIKPYLEKTIFPVDFVNEFYVPDLNSRKSRMSVSVI